MNISLKIIVVLFLMMSASASLTQAQTSDSEKYTIIFRDAQLDDALEQLVTTTKINLLYNPDIIEDIVVTCSAKKEKAESILRCLIKDAELDFYRLSSGTYVVIEKAEEPPKLGNLAGIVVDKSTGEPLPYANVLLSDASVGTATNTAGMFTFSSLLTGPHEIVTTYIGYQSSRDSVWIQPDGRSRQRIELEPSAIVAEPIVVNGIHQRLPSEGLGKSSKDQADFQVPSTLGGGDPIYSVSSVMNVGVRPPFVDLHIQGGAAGEHLTLLDGVPVFEPISLGRMMGAFSPLAIGRITVHKAGFGASVGSQLSGVLDIEQDLTSSEYRAFTLQIDPLSVNGRVNFSVDLPGSASMDFMTSARTSYWDIFQYTTLNSLLEDWNTVDPLLSETAIGSLDSDKALFTPHRHGSDVSFSDIHAASAITINPFHKLFLSFYQGSNKIGSELLSSESAQTTNDAFILLTRDSYDWANTTAQIRHNWLMGARTLGMLRLRNSLHSLHHNYQFRDNQTAQIPEGSDVAFIEEALINELNQDGTPADRNRIRETALEGTVDFSLDAGSHLQLGFELTQINNSFSLSSPFFIPFSHDFDGWRSAGFVQNTLSIGLKSVLEIGSRFTYIPDRAAVYAEPRISFRHDIPNTASGSYSFQFASGLYRQFTNPLDLSNAGPSAAVPSIRFWIPNDETVSPTRAIHVAGNVLWVPQEDTQVRLETFYKDQPRILELDYITLLTDVSKAGQSLSADDLTDPAKGYSYGGGLYLEKKFLKGVSSMQYSYSVAKRRYPNRFENNRVQSTPWNEPHRLTFAQDVFITQEITTQLRANGIWGRTWGFRQTYYDYLAAHNGATAYEPFVLNNPSDDKLPPIYQVDAGVSYERAFKDVRVQLRADVLNVLNRDNVVDWSLVNTTNTESFEKIERIMPGITTALSLRVKF
ncbi:MAG: TonB-dependent receptor [Rhodothermaceae bacterium]|nr:TonB-dependent receptor [Rhodothermaceae bacterium]